MHLLGLLCLVTSALILIDQSRVTPGYTMMSIVPRPHPRLPSPPRWTPLVDCSVI